MKVGQPRQGFCPRFPIAARIVEERTGLCLEGFEPADVEASMMAVMRDLRLSSLGALAVRLSEGDEDAFERVVETLIVPETYFFRDALQIQYLRHDFIPRLLAERERPLRVMSAGCSTGEEAHTLAMLLDEAGALDGATVLGSDISRRSLDRARAATYRNWSLRGVDPIQVARWFVEQEELYQVLPRLRAGTRFLHVNLVGEDYPSVISGIWDLDLILCRNVFIYWSRDAVRKAALRLFDSLVEGGWLILGASDPILEGVPFESVTTSAGTFYRRPGPACQPRVSRLAVAAKLPGSEGDLDTSALGAVGPALRAARLAASAAMAALRPQTGATDAVPPVPPRSSGGIPSAQIDPTAEETVARASAGVTGTDRRGEGESGDWLPESVEQVLEHLRELTRTQPGRSVIALAARAVTVHPMSTELRFLHALVLMDGGHNQDALHAFERLLYLDPTLAIVHFYVGVLQVRLGDREAARRAMRNVCVLSGRLPRETVLALSPDEQAGMLYDAACAHLSTLGGES